MLLNVLDDGKDPVKRLFAAWKRGLVFRRLIQRIDVYEHLRQTDFTVDLLSIVGTLWREVIIQLFDLLQQPLQLIFSELVTVIEVSVIQKQEVRSNPAVETPLTSSASKLIA